MAVGSLPRIAKACIERRFVARLSSRRTAQTVLCAGKHFRTPSILNVQVRIAPQCPMDLGAVLSFLEKVKCKQEMCLKAAGILGGESTTAAPSFGRRLPQRCWLPVLLKRSHPPHSLTLEVDLWRAFLIFGQPVCS